jgi:hypothetical protein
MRRVSLFSMLAIQTQLTQYIIPKTQTILPFLYSKLDLATSKWTQTMSPELSSSPQKQVSSTQSVISSTSTSSATHLTKIQVVEKLMAQSKLVRAKELGVLMFQISKSNPWQGD